MGTAHCCGDSCIDCMAGDCVQSASCQSDGTCKIATCEDGYALSSNNTCLPVVITNAVNWKSIVHKAKAWLPENVSLMGRAKSLVPVNTNSIQKEINASLKNAFGVKQNV